MKFRAIAAMFALLLLAGVASAQTPTPTAHACGGTAVYWVCPDGGNTADSACWSCTSGGAPYAPIPDYTNTTLDCVFDTAFNPSATVTTDNASTTLGCKNLTWASATGSPTWSVSGVGNFVLLTGDMTLIGGMTVTWTTDVVAEMYGDVTHHLTSASKVIGNVQVDSPASTSNGLEMMDDLEVPGGEFQVQAGAFLTTNNHNYRGEEVDTSGGNVTLNGGTSTFLVDQWLANTNTDIYVMGNSTIEFAYNQSVPVIRLNCQPSQQYGIVHVLHGNTDTDLGQEAGFCPIHSLILDPGQGFAGGDPGVAIDSLTCNGTSGEHINLSQMSGLFGSQVACSFADVGASSDCEGVTPCYAGAGGSVAGGAVNWLAQDAPATPTPTVTETPTITETPTPYGTPFVFCNPTPGQDFVSVQAVDTNYCPATTPTPSTGTLVISRSGVAGEGGTIYTVGNALMKWLTGPTLALKTVTSAYITGVYESITSTPGDSSKYAVGWEGLPWSDAVPGDCYVCTQPGASCANVSAINGTQLNFPVDIPGGPFTQQCDGIFNPLAFINTGSGDGFSRAGVITICPGNPGSVCGLGGDTPTGTNEFAISVATPPCLHVYAVDISPTVGPSPTPTGQAVDCNDACNWSEGCGACLCNGDGCAAFFAACATEITCATGGGCPTPCPVGPTCAAFVAGSGCAGPGVCNCASSGPTPTPTPTGPTRTPTRTPARGCCVCPVPCDSGPGCGDGLTESECMNEACFAGAPTPGCTPAYHAGLTCASGCGGDWPTPSHTPSRTRTPTSTPTITQTFTPTRTPTCNPTLLATISVTCKASGYGNIIVGPCSRGADFVLPPNPPVAFYQLQIDSMTKHGGFEPQAVPKPVEALQLLLDIIGPPRPSSGGGPVRSQIGFEFSPVVLGVAHRESAALSLNRQWIEGAMVGTAPSPPYKEQDRIQMTVGSKRQGVIEISGTLSAMGCQ